MKRILTIILILYCTITFSQTDSVKNIIDKKLTKVMSEVREGESRYYQDFNMLLISYPEYSFRRIKEYESDSSDLVVEEIVNNYSMLKSASKEQSFQQKITFELLKIYHQRKQPLNDYNTFYIPQTLSNPDETKTSDFNAESKQLLVELLKDSLISRRVLKVIGIAGMQDQIPELKKFLPGGERYRKDNVAYFYFSSWEWYARLAMARLGDQEQIKFCVEKIENSEEEMMSNSYAAGNYFDDLIYIKKPEVLPFLFDMLLSNTKFPDDPIYSTLSSTNKCNTIG